MDWAAWGTWRSSLPGNLAIAPWRSVAAKKKKHWPTSWAPIILLMPGRRTPPRNSRNSAGARTILATAPNSQAISGLINGLGPDGQLIIVAWLNEPMQISPWQLLGGRRSVKGWTARLARNSSEDTLKFSVSAGIVPMVEVFPLEQAALAFEKMVSSKVHIRSVLKMDGNA
jgi:D-arabinose 1-dehydrogenase-like Zn-dependent alcohol dehydrogenase